MGNKRDIHEQNHGGAIHSTPVKTSKQPTGNATLADSPPEKDLDKGSGVLSQATPPLRATVSAENELPAGGGANRIVLLPVAPDRVHIYWEIDRRVMAESGLTAAGEESRLRILLQSHEAVESPEEAPSLPIFLEVEPAADTRKCYVSLPKPEQTLSAAVGLQTRQGIFVPLAESNRITTPALHPAAKTEPSPPGPAGAQRLPQLPERAIPATSPEATGKQHPGEFPVPEEIVRRRIAEFYSLIYRVDFSPPEESAQSPDSPEQHIQKRVLDLTEFSEQRFALGTSSAVKNGASSAPRTADDG